MITMTLLTLTIIILLKFMMPAKNVLFTLIRSKVRGVNVHGPNLQHRPVSNVLLHQKTHILDVQGQGHKI